MQTDTVSKIDEKERLQALHLALESALEQLGYAQQAASRGTEITQVSPEIVRLERIYGDLVSLRNEVREALMKAMARPSLNVLK